LMEEIVRERFSKPDVKKGYILDGYPRTENQAAFFEKMAKELKISPPTVIYFAMPKGELVDRLLGRLTCPKCGAVYHRKLNPPKNDLVCDVCGYAPVEQRKDDTEDTIVRRLQVFENETSSLMGFYRKQNRLQEVNAGSAVDSITEDLKKRLEKKAS
jgi:adenylate kinase